MNARAISKTQLGEVIREKCDEIKSFIICISLILFLFHLKESKFYLNKILPNLFSFMTSSFLLCGSWNRKQCKAISKRNGNSHPQSLYSLLLKFIQWDSEQVVSRLVNPRGFLSTTNFFSSLFNFFLLEKDSMTPYEFWLFFLFFYE